MILPLLPHITYTVAVYSLDLRSLRFLLPHHTRYTFARIYSGSLPVLYLPLPVGSPRRVLPLHGFVATRALHAYAVAVCVRYVYGSFGLRSGYLVLRYTRLLLPVVHRLPRCCGYVLRYTLRLPVIVGSHTFTCGWFYRSFGYTPVCVTHARTHGCVTHAPFTPLRSVWFTRLRTPHPLPLRVLPTLPATLRSAVAVHCVYIHLTVVPFTTRGCLHGSDFTGCTFTGYARTHTVCRARAARAHFPVTVHGYTPAARYHRTVHHLVAFVGYIRTTHTTRSPRRVLPILRWITMVVLLPLRFTFLRSDFGCYWFTRLRCLWLVTVTVYRYPFTTLPVLALPFTTPTSPITHTCRYLRLRRAHGYVVTTFCTYRLRHVYYALRLLPVTVMPALVLR